MNAITLSEQAKQQALTMSTRLIAELTGKEHKNVKRDCETMFLELGIDALNFELIYLDSMNRQQVEYLLPKNLVETLITGYSIKLRYQVIQRLNELENQSQLVNIDLNNPHSLRRALLDYADRNIELEAKNTSLEYSIKTITQTNHGVKFQQACKILNVKRHVLAKWLRTHGWDRHLNDSRASTYYSQERGYCETKYCEVTRLNKYGEQYNYTQIEFFILPKGMDVLAKHFVQEVKS